MDRFEELERALGLAEAQQGHAAQMASRVQELEAQLASLQQQVSPDFQRLKRPPRPACTAPLHRRPSLGDSFCTRVPAHRFPPDHNGRA